MTDIPYSALCDLKYVIVLVDLHESFARNSNARARSNFQVRMRALSRSLWLSFRLEFPAAYCHLI